MGCRIVSEDVAIKTPLKPERSPVRLLRGWSHACQKKKIKQKKKFNHLELAKN
jgi:hypothetical protein